MYLNLMLLDQFLLSYRAETWKHKTTERRKHTDTKAHTETRTSTL